MKAFTVLGVMLACILLASTFLVGLTSSANAYNPWFDTDDDGDIDIFDMVRMAGSYGTTGTPFEAKAAIGYDSGWIDITDKTGQYFTVDHGLNSTEIIVDITGKTMENSGLHQRNLGGESYTPGFQKQYGHWSLYSGDRSYSAIHTSDGGYLLVGVIGYMADFWLVKTDSGGNVQWNRTYGGAGADVAYSVVEVSDGYAIAGETDSSGSGSSDFWLVKTNSTGHLQWNKTYGGPLGDVALAIVSFNGGGFVLAGYTGFPESVDFWLLKLNSTGHEEWNKTYGGIGYEFAFSLIQTTDGGLAIAGETTSTGAGFGDFWLVKTDSAGNVQWNKTYGTVSQEGAPCVEQTADGGYVLAGHTYMNGPGDCWMVKTDSSGNQEWNRTYGKFPSSDIAKGVVQTSDGGYAIAATGFANLIKTDTNGEMLWSLNLGVDAWTVIEVSNGTYVLAGSTEALTSSVDNFWLFKTSSFQYGLAWMFSTLDDLTLYRGVEDPDWNYVRVRIWKIRETP